MIRKRMDELQAQTQAEKEWWERRKGEIQTNFMKELDDEKSAVTSPTVSTKGSVASPTGTGKSGSDEDAVMVEAGGPKDSQGGGGGKKKKKGKH